MKRATKCTACRHDARYVGPAGGNPLPDVHRAAVMWWDRVPGWFRDTIRDPAPLTYSPTPYGTPVCSMSPDQLAAELRRQSARLGSALVGDFAGPRAAEEYVLARRVALGLNHLQEVAA